MNGKVLKGKQPYFAKCCGETKNKGKRNYRPSTVIMYFLRSINLKAPPKPPRYL